MYTAYLHFSRPCPMDGKGCHRVHTTPKVPVCIWYAYVSSTSSVLIFTLLPSRCQFSVLWVVMYHSYTHKPWVLAECFSLFTWFSTAHQVGWKLGSAFGGSLCLKLLSSHMFQATSAIKNQLQKLQQCLWQDSRWRIHCIKLYHETMRFWFWFCMLLICCSLDFVWLLQEFLVVGGVTFGHPWYLA